MKNVGFTKRKLGQILRKTFSEISSREGEENSNTFTSFDIRYFRFLIKNHYQYFKNRNPLSFLHFTWNDMKFFYPTFLHFQALFAPFFFPFPNYSMGNEKDAFSWILIYENYFNFIQVEIILMENDDENDGNFFFNMHFTFEWENCILK